MVNDSDEAVRAFEIKLNEIIGFHNIVRVLLPHEYQELAHLQNENTVLRIAALLEECNYKPDKDKFRGALDRDDCYGMRSVGTLIYLRNLIIHNGGRCKVLGDGAAWYKAFVKFGEEYPATNAKEGDIFCLAVDTVLQPLCGGIIEYVRDRKFKGMVSDEPRTRRKRCCK